MAQFPVGSDQKHHLIQFDLAMANRHGLITGATGTGKTVSLQKIAEQFSQLGVPVFSADIKGDLSGIAFPADKDNPILKKRLQDLKIDQFTPAGCPVVFWDIYAKNGHPLRTTVSEVGPLLFARLLNLNETQEGIINAAFSLADDAGWLLLDLKDFRSLLTWMGENANELKSKYGNITTTSIGAIQRGLLSLEEAGGDHFFGEPAFKIDHLFQKDTSGLGIIHILDATKLIQDGRLYSTFLLWLLSELFETLPEVGDIDKPKLVFFFDEAHLLFNAAPKPLLEKINQLVRLIRSKGIGVYFVTQTPLDIPESVLGQLGNRVQHALRGFTPKDQKSIRAAAQTFRQNPKLDTESTIRELGVGEALLSFLDTSGAPTMVEKAKVIPPVSRIGAISANERQALIKKSPFYGVYDEPMDRESAYEMLQNLTHKMQVEKENKERVGTSTSHTRGRPRQSVTEAVITSTARSFGTQIGRQIVRGILGSIFGKK